VDLLGALGHTRDRIDLIEADPFDRVDRSALARGLLRRGDGRFDRGVPEPSLFRALAEPAAKVGLDILAAGEVELSTEGRVAALALDVPAAGAVEAAEHEIELRVAVAGFDGRGRG